MHVHMYVVSMLFEAGPVNTLKAVIFLLEAGLPLCTASYSCGGSLLSSSCFKDCAHLLVQSLTGFGGLSWGGGTADSSKDSFIPASSLSCAKATRSYLWDEQEKGTAVELAGEHC